MKITIYTMTHKEFTPPTDAIYKPLWVNCDSGDNIAHKNCYYSELTGHYWVYKNDTDSDIIGTCHYRRYLMDDEGKLMSTDAILQALNNFDLITTKKVHLNNSYRYGFSANHNLAALDTAGEVIRDLYPEYYDAFISLVNGPDTYFGNMFITTRSLYMKYCEWLFTIFAEVEKRIDLDTDEDAYHKRVLGFISEFLLLVWVTVNNLKVKECKVAMLGEKAETRELKLKLAECFGRKDEQQAKSVLLEALNKRPDLLMEASDITGELRMSMELIAIVEEERAHEKICLLDKETDFNELMKIISELNSEILQRRHNTQAHEGANTSEISFSDSAVRIANAVLPDSGIITP